MRAAITMVRAVGGLLLVVGCGSSGGKPATNGNAGAGQSGGGNGGNGGFAGNDNRGGLGGSPTLPKPISGDCSNLGAPGQFQDITPQGVNAALNVVVDPVTTGTLYLGTDKTGIWKSVDCGAHWDLLSKGMNSDIINSGSNWLLIVDRFNPAVMYSHALFGKDGALYRSADGGNSWSSLFGPTTDVAKAFTYADFQWASIDPEHPEHLLASFHTNCKPEFGAMCLAETLNSGATWTIIKGPTPGWQEAAQPIILNASTWIFGTGLDGIHVTTDSGKTWQKGVGNCGSQVYRDGGEIYLTGQGGIHRSNNGVDWTHLKDSPKADAIIGIGDKLYVSERYPPQPDYALFTGPKDGSGPWTSIEVPEGFRGAAFFAYDEEHKVLYSANGENGGKLWRMTVVP